VFRIPECELSKDVLWIRCGRVPTKSVRPLEGLEAQLAESVELSAAEPQGGDQQLSPRTASRSVPAEKIVGLSKQSPPEGGAGITESEIGLCKVHSEASAIDAMARIGLDLAEIIPTLYEEGCRSRW
jgi:hypothetical protein